MLLLFLTPVFPAHAATFVVTKTADTNDGVCDSDCSLREAIIAANANPGADIITLPAGTYTLTIPGKNEDAGATGDLDITDDLTINGAGVATTIVDGGAIDRVFQVVTGIVAFNDLTVRNGLPGSGDNGGGILISSGTLAITRCTISGNNTTNGGNGAGIYADGSFTITDSTISGNTAGGGNGGGIYDNAGALTITGSTITGNSVLPNGDGGGIYNNANGIILTNCTINGNSAFDGAGIFNNGIIVNTINATIASNSATNTGGGIENNGSAALTSTIVANNAGGNCSGASITDGGTNLQFPGISCGASITSADPLLGPLADNGGPTQTMALGAGSPAIDAGTEICPPVPPTDQRGVSRPQGPACDIGAFEVQGAVTPTPTPTGSATPTPTVTGVPPTPTVTPTPLPGPAAAVPTLSWPMLVLFGLALAAAAIFFLKRS